jgi:hypothetical protein
MANMADIDPENEEVIYLLSSQVNFQILITNSASNPRSGTQ